MIKINDESIKITIRFLSNEISAASSLKIIVHKKIVKMKIIVK